MFRLRHGVDRGIEFGQYRDVNLCAGLLLTKRKDSVLDMLAAESNDITAPLHRSVQQLKRQPSAGADRMLVPVDCNMLIGPGLEAPGIGDAVQLDADGRVGVDKSVR